MPKHKHAKHPIRNGAKLKAVHSPEYLKFIDDAAGPAQSSELQTGVPASITIAQAILESAWGKHHIGSANNYFGVKAQEDKKGNVSYGSIATGYVDTKTQEHIAGKDITITDHFRKYTNMTDSFTDHGMFLKNNSIYKSALDDYAKSGDADEFARGLQKVHYATDPNYAETLIKIMTQRKLYRYNKVTKVTNTPTEKSPDPAKK